MFIKFFASTLALSAGFTLWPNNLTDPMSGSAPSGIQEVASDSESGVVVTSTDNDTFFNDVTEELEKVDSIAHDIVVVALRSGTQLSFANNGVAGGVRTRTHAIKAIHVHAGQPAEIRTDDYKAIDSANNPIKDSDIPFSHVVKILPITACPPHDPEDG